MEPWRLLTTPDASPVLNMGLDELLLERGPPQPVLRFYTWSPDTLSLGWFQRFAEVRGSARASALVRRITGGGAIHHARELTFSIAAPAEHALYRGPLARSYERVHAWIAAALGELGVDARLRGDERLASDHAGTGMCFQASTPLDLAWDGCKGVGSAQRRRGGRVLHHGSIKLGPTALDDRVALLAGGLEPMDLVAPLLAALRRIGFEPVAGEPTAEERAEAARRGARYVDPAVVRRR